jgi:23S rRNA G2445 N2-methylase RlmL
VTKPWDLRLGRWQDVLADVTECDAVITDPPYGERTHSGQHVGSRPLGGGGRKTTINYPPMCPGGPRRYQHV